MKFWTVASVATALAFVAPDDVSAQDASQAEAGTEQEELAEARAIMDVMFPPAERDAIFRGMIEDMMGPVANGLLTDPVFEEPGVRALADEYLEGYLERSFPVVREHMPAIIEATARAYAREFTLLELREIHAFATTPTGSRYFRQMSSLLADADVTAANQAYMTAIGARQTEEQRILRKMLTQYFEENPDVLERIRSKRSSPD